MTPRATKHWLSACHTDYQAVDFWSQCIGDTEADMNGYSDQGTTALMDPEASDALGSGREIKQLVQDEV